MVGRIGRPDTHRREPLALVDIVAADAEPLTVDTVQVREKIIRPRHAQIYTGTSLRIGGPELDRDPVVPVHALVPVACFLGEKMVRIDPGLVL